MLSNKYLFYGSVFVRFVSLVFIYASLQDCIMRLFKQHRLFETSVISIIRKIKKMEFELKKIELKLSDTIIKDINDTNDDTIIKDINDINNEIIINEINNIITKEINDINDDTITEETKDKDNLITEHISNYQQKDVYGVEINVTNLAHYCYNQTNKNTKLAQNFWIKKIWSRIFE